MLVKGVLLDFIHRKNLESCRKQLARTASDADRRLMEKRLADEEASEPLQRKVPDGRAGER